MVVRQAINSKLKVSDLKRKAGGVFVVHEPDDLPSKEVLETKLATAQAERATAELEKLVEFGARESEAVYKIVRGKLG